MDHPSKGTAGEEAKAAASFRYCRPDRRCGVCKLLTGQQRRERALFKMVMSQDPALLGGLKRLSGLFYDSAVTA